MFQRPVYVPNQEWVRIRSMSSAATAKFCASLIDMDWFQVSTSSESLEVGPQSFGIQNPYLTSAIAMTDQPVELEQIVNGKDRNNGISPKLIDGNGDSFLSKDRKLSF